MEGNRTQAGESLLVDVAMIAYVLGGIVLVLAALGWIVQFGQRIFDPPPFKESWATEQCHDAAKSEMFPADGDDEFLYWDFETAEFLESDYWSQDGFVISNHTWPDGQVKSSQRGWSCIISPDEELTIGYGPVSAEMKVLGDKCWRYILHHTSVPETLNRPDLYKDVHVLHKDVTHDMNTKVTVGNYSCLVDKDTWEVTQRLIGE